MPPERKAKESYMSYHFIPPSNSTPFISLTFHPRERFFGFESWSSALLWVPFLRQSLFFFSFGCSALPTEDRVPLLLRDREWKPGGLPPCPDPDRSLPSSRSGSVGWEGRRRGSRWDPGPDPDRDLPGPDRTRRDRDPLDRRKGGPSIPRSDPDVAMGFLVWFLQWLIRDLDVLGVFLNDSW